jgi:purine-binding chemotaxis protein CheW
MSASEITGITEYLSFTLGEEDFALEIGKVREVLDYTSIIKVPRMPEFLRVVINLRGNVVPVVDLRLKLGMSATERTVNTCIVIIEIELEGKLVQMGALVDSVQEVFTLDPEQIQPPPRLGSKLRTDFIKGMGKRGESFLIILDVDMVFSSDELALMDAAPKSVENAEESR